MILKLIEDAEPSLLVRPEGGIGNEPGQGLGRGRGVFVARSGIAQLGTQLGTSAVEERAHLLGAVSGLAGLLEDGKPREDAVESPSKG